MLPELEENARHWLDKYPALKQEQITDPLITVHKLRAELQELEQSIHEKDDFGVLDELTDVLNYAAQLRMVIEACFNITEQEVLDHSRYKYRVRNTLKYNPDHYQGNVDTEKQAAADCNVWYFYQAYFNNPEQGYGGEYY